ncbi:MAG: hypothetical protein ACRCVT_01980 [Leadbetterella sp.]
MLKLKHTILLFLTIFSILGTSAQVKPKPVAPVAPKTAGVNWETNLNTALAKAKAQNKLLFIEGYLKTCPVCMSIAPFFNKPEVAEAYNSRFINYKIELNDKAEEKFLRDRKLTFHSFPQFMFFNGDGQIQHMGMGASPDAKALVNLAKVASDPKNHSINYASRFASGDRDMNFLISFASYARLTNDSTHCVSVGNEMFKIYPKEKLSTEESWLITKQCISDLENGFIQHWFQNVNLANQYGNKAGHENEGYSTLGGAIQYSLLGKIGKTYDYNKLLDIREKMKTVAAGQYADSFLWEFEVKALIKEKREAEAMQIVRKMYNTQLDNYLSQLYFVRVVNDNFKEVAHINEAKKWLTAVFPKIDKDQFKSEYFIETARIQLYEGDKSAAQKSLEEAKTLAVKTNAKDALNRIDVFEKLTKN